MSCISSKLLTLGANIDPLALAVWQKLGFVPGAMSIDELVHRALANKKYDGRGRVLGMLWGYLAQQEYGGLETKS